MLYIATWNWHILAIIFLVSSLIVIAVGQGVISAVLFVAFILAFLLCEIASGYRRIKLSDYGTNEFLKDIDRSIKEDE